MSPARAATADFTPRARSGARAGAGAVVVVVVALALYARTLGFGLSYLDDDALILDQQSFLSQPASVWRAFGRPYFPSSGRDHAYYRPLVSASYALDARFAGNSPAGGHLTNVLLHALCAGLLFALLRRLGHGDGVALFGALVFAVHPAVTEAVAWIPGRNDSLLAAFALVSWLLLLRSWDGGRWPSRVGHLCAWLAALGTKETALVLPPLLLAHALLVERRPWRAVVAPWLLAGWTVVLVVYLAARAAVVSAGLGAAGVSPGGFLSNASVLVSGLGKILLPVDLSVLATRQDSSLAPGAIAALSLLAAVAFVPRIRRAPVVFAIACFVAFLAPSLPASSVLALESRLYLPAIGLVLVVCEVGRGVGWPPRAKLAAAGAIVAVLAARALSYSGNFRDRLAFSEAAVRGSPHSALAHRNLGITHQIAGDAASAQREYETALVEDPSEPVVHNNLAVLMMARGQLPEAERQLREELAINPLYAQAHHNLALVLRALGRSDEAAEHWQKSLELGAGRPGS